MKYFSAFLTCLLLISGSSCHSKKSLVNGSHRPGIPVVEDLEVTLERLAMTQVPYTWFAGSGQGKIDWDGDRYSVRFNVRILKDSVIWMQISKFGFEVGRMYVTPDSSFFINRLEHTYSVYKTIDFLNEYNVPADFDLFSRVFTAGAYIPNPTTEVSRGEEGSVIMRGENGVTAQHWLDLNGLYKSFIQDSMHHEWTAGYAAYQPTVSGQTFPFSRTNALLIDGQVNVFDLEYNQVEIDVPQDFPFSIPSHYEKE